MHATTATATGTATARVTTGPWGRSALLLGILAVTQYLVGFVLLVWVWPGDPLVIAITTTLQYVLPLAGVVVGHLARRREGSGVASSTGLVLSYLCLLAAVVPLIGDLVALMVAS